MALNHTYTMRKVAGWIISRESVDKWRESHPELDVQHWSAEKTVTADVERMYIALWRLKKPIPFPKRAILHLQWPKMTPERRGGDTCLIARRIIVVPGESWVDYAPIAMDSSDEEVLVKMTTDGLVPSEWITIPDPFQEEWPFAKRHPGEMIPPENPLPLEKAHTPNDSGRNAVSV